MHLVELHELIENGEDGRIEFKRKFSTAEKIAKEMIAFANTKGGKIIFGVDDDRSVVGVESEKGEIELIDMAARFYCEPAIDYTSEIINIYRKDVVVVGIQESKQKPHRLVLHNGSLRPSADQGNRSVRPPDEHDRVYIRVKDKSLLASKETVKILKNSNPNSRPLIFSLGDRERFLLDYLSKHERITLVTFRGLLNLSRRRASRILVNMVRAELIRIHTPSGGEDFYTLS
jgi:predicted HTH transcriptional regulator